MTAIGFVGLGAMGGRIAGSLLAAGHQGHATNRTEARAPLALELPEEAWFDVRFMHKDIGLALAMARELGIRLPSAEAAGDELTRAEELGYGARDIASAYDVLARMAVS